MELKGSLDLRDKRWRLIINYKDKFGRYQRKRIQTDLPERGNKKVAEKLLETELEKFKEVLTKVVIQKEGVDPNIPFIKYLKDHAKKRVENKEITPITYSGYSQYIGMLEKFFKNDFLLKNLTVELMDLFYDDCDERENTDTTKKHYISVLNPPLRDAFKDGLIETNLVEELPKFRPKKFKIKAYRPHEIDKLFEVLKGHKIELTTYLAVYYATRRSENIGLRWDSIDFDLDTIAINHKVLQDSNGELFASNELKTESSERSLPLLTFMKEKLLEKKARIEQNRKLYGKCYNEEYLDYVNVDDIGNILKPSYVTQVFGKILNKHKLRKIRFHDLRHSCARLLKRAGIPLKDIQSWLGHANYKTTADTYLDTDEEDMLDVARVIDSVLTKKAEPCLETEVEQLRESLKQKEEQLAKKKRKDFEM